MTKTTPKLVGILAGTLITLAAFGTSAIEKAAGAGPPLAITAVSHSAPWTNIRHVAQRRAHRQGQRRHRQLGRRAGPLPGHRGSRGSCSGS